MSIHIFKYSKIPFLLALFCSLAGFTSIDSNYRNNIIGKQKKEIKIGFLYSNMSDSSALHAAELAIEEVNKQGGGNGTYFKLVAYSVEGAWGIGSKKSVKMVFEDKVWAIVGSLDGRNAHLAEQVATKTHITFLSTWATDPTLSQAFVPWYFRCIFNDNQQAETLVTEIYKKDKQKKIAIISNKSYDASMSSKSLINEVVAKGNLTPEVFTIENDSPDHIKRILSNITKSQIKTVVLLVASGYSNSIIGFAADQNLAIQFYCDIASYDHSIIKLPNSIEIIVISPNYWFTETGKSFQYEFKKKYGYCPGAKAAFSYDGINLILEAICKAGLDHEKIKSTLSSISYEISVTGKINFDKMGNRIDNPSLVKIEDVNQLLIIKDYE